MNANAAEKPRDAGKPDREAGAFAIGAATFVLDCCAWVGREAVMPAIEWAIPHGAKELSNLLYTGSAYNHSNRPVPIPDAHGVHGPEQTLEEKARDAADFAEAVALEKDARAAEAEGRARPAEIGLYGWAHQPTDMQPPEI